MKKIPKSVTVEEDIEIKYENGLTISSCPEDLDKNISIESLKSAVDALHGRNGTTTVIAFGATKKGGPIVPVSFDMPNNIRVFTAREVRDALKRRKRLIGKK